MRISLLKKIAKLQKIIERLRRGEIVEYECRFKVATFACSKTDYIVRKAIVPPRKCLGPPIHSLNAYLNI